MRIAFLEGFYTGSHKRWADAVCTHGAFQYTLFTLPGRFWKWRMHGGAVTLARQFMEDDTPFDAILATDMIDLSVFLALTRSKSSKIPVLLYFHENQITYPWSRQDRDVQKNRNQHYGFINLTSALAADVVLFNSTYHKAAFIEALPAFIKQFPDYRFNVAQTIEERASVVYPGINLEELDKHKPEGKRGEYAKWPILLWNHRWEYDKNPTQWFTMLKALRERGVRFSLVILGEQTDTKPEVFQQIKDTFKEDILFMGYAKTREEYISWLWKADILPVTSNQEFYGISVLEAMACGVFPLLPKRLVYPEHLPKAYEATFFYKDERDLINRLQRLIFDVALPRKMNLRQYAAKHDERKTIAQLEEQITKHSL